MKFRRKLNKEKAIIACKLINKDINSYRTYTYDGFTYYRISLTNEEFAKVNELYKELIKPKNTPMIESAENVVEDEEYQRYLELKNAETKLFEFVDTKDDKVKRYAVALFSDVHIESKVNSDSVLGLNEYDLDIAKKRIENYFKGLSACIEKDEVETLYFCIIGDIIDGWLREEAMQENQMSPIQAVLYAQSLICSGLAYLRNSHPKTKVLVVCTVGNHSRSSKKMQSNSFKLSYEWMLFKNIEQFAQAANLNMNFIIPESEIALVQAPDGKRFIITHGHQIKSSGNATVCGIYPSLQRLAMKWDRTFHQDKMYIGHFHSCINIPTAMVNGSIIGYNAFAMSNGFPYERPCQAYDLYDHKLGNILSRKIYCDIDE
mgnify:CR=1 FL=1